MRACSVVKHISLRAFSVYKLHLRNQKMFDLIRFRAKESVLFKSVHHHQGQSEGCVILLVIVTEQDKHGKH